MSDRLFKIPDGTPMQGYPAWEGDVSEITVFIRDKQPASACQHCRAVATKVDIRTPSQVGLYNRCMNCIGDELRKHGIVW